VLMLSIDAANKPLQRHFKFSAAIQPGLMHSVAGAINIAPPDTLKAQEHVATKLRSRPLELIRESDWRICPQICDRSEQPVVRRPVLGRNQSRRVAKIDNPVCEPFQIRFRAAAG